MWSHASPPVSNWYLADEFGRWRLDNNWDLIDDEAGTVGRWRCIAVSKSMAVKEFIHKSFPQ